MTTEKTQEEMTVSEKIRKRVFQLEQYNLAQREFSASQMEDKIRKIIEEEVGK